MNVTQKNSLEVLKAAIWDRDLPRQDLNWREIYEFLIQHAVEGLVGNYINKWEIPNDIKQEWQIRIYSSIRYYFQTRHIQQKILCSLHERNIPVVVLKGTSAAYYYPIPQFRALGDIDLLVLPNDFDRASAVLEAEGFQDISRTKERHATYTKSGVLIELHWRFGSKNELKNPKEFDDIIYNDIVLNRYYLNDVQNGLILLEHIIQHCRGGIGLRHIIDWMLYVSKFLVDETWENEFKSYAESLGLDNFAITVTRMCQLYLGLRNDINWCKNADEKLCSEFMEYVLSCGNFGVSLTGDEANVISLIPSIKHPIKLARFLQVRGEENWKLLSKYQWLKPVSFIYQAVLYCEIVHKNRLNIGKMKTLRKERNKMFEKLHLAD